MTGSMYHIVLRTSALTLALMLLFDSGLMSPFTKQLSQNTQHYLAQTIGMYAAVEPTELNQLTAQLTEREQQLNKREASLKDRELNVGLNSDTGGWRIDSTFVLSVLLFLLLVLIVLNYIFDFVRSRNPIPLSRQYENVG